MTKNIIILLVLTHSLVGVSNTLAQVDSVFTNSEIIEEELIEDPSRDRLFFAPTAKNLKAGSGTVGLRMIINPYFSVGITDNISVSASFLPLPLFGSFFSFSTKLNLYSYNNFDLSAGVFYLIRSVSYKFLPVKLGADGQLSFFYGVSSYSNSDYLVNIGGGFNPLSNDYFIFIGGEIRITTKSKFIVDNWLLKNGSSILSVGAKTFNKRFSFAMGLIGFFNKLHPNAGVWIEGAVHF